MTPRSYCALRVRFLLPAASLRSRIMNLSPWHCGLPTLVLSLANLCGAQTSDRPFALSRGQFWIEGWATRPSFSLAGDVDGDGRADLIAFQPGGRAWVDVHLTSPLGKPTPWTAGPRPVRARWSRRDLWPIHGPPGR